jgi:hypothetical protein
MFWMNVRVNPVSKNVFHQDDVPALHRAVHIFHQLDLATVLLGVSIARHRDEIEADVERDLPRQVGKKNGGALQHSDQHDRFTGKILADALPHLGHLRRDAFPPDQHPELVHRPST